MPNQSLTVDTILKMITAELRVAGSRRRLASNDGLPNDGASGLKLTITADVHETEYDFIRRFGMGTIFTFSLSCYEEGKRLAEQISHRASCMHPDLSIGDCDQFRRTDLLYLFIYLNLREGGSSFPSA